jgi:hypothetical protein
LDGLGTLFSYFLGPRQRLFSDAADLEQQLAYLGF